MKCMAETACVEETAQPMRDEEMVQLVNQEGPGACLMLVKLNDCMVSQLQPSYDFADVEAGGVEVAFVLDVERES